MRAVTKVDTGVVEVNYMWLPTWIGMNSLLLEEIGKEVKGKLVGKTMEDGLELGHQAVLNYLVNRFPEMTGLREYLDGLKLVMVHGPEETQG